MDVMGRQFLVTMATQTHTYLHKLLWQTVFQGLRSPLDKELLQKYQYALDHA